VYNPVGSDRIFILLRQVGAKMLSLNSHQAHASLRHDDSSNMLPHKAVVVGAGVGAGVKSTIGGAPSRPKEGASDG